MQTWDHPPLRAKQFGLRSLLAVVTAAAVIFGLARWGQLGGTVIFGIGYTSFFAGLAIKPRTAFAGTFLMAAGTATMVGGFALML